MPTITIRTPMPPPARRRAIAVQLTRWFSNHGIDPTHTVICFIDTGGDTVFSGAMPLDARRREGTALPFASVDCCVGPERDERFRADLAEEIVTILKAVRETPFLYIEFRPVDPGLVYYAREGRLVRADRPGAMSELGKEES